MVMGNVSLKRLLINETGDGEGPNMGSIRIFFPSISSKNAECPNHVTRVRVSCVLVNSSVFRLTTGIDQAGRLFPLLFNHSGIIFSICPKLMFTETPPLFSNFSPVNLGEPTKEAD